MLRAGAGRTDITPPVGIAHAGWGAATHERAEGVDMPFSSTALYVTDGDTEAAIVDIDILLLPDDLERAIRSAIVDATAVPADHIWLGATHTHSGTEFRDTWLVEGTELVGPYLGSLPAKIAESVVTAKESARPVVVGGGAGECAINVNRRPVAPDGFVFTGRNWDGFADHTVSVVAIDGADREPIATIVGYACHPTVLGPANRLLSPDYPGHMRRVVESNVGGLCLFLQGAAGNQGPVDGFIGDPAVPHRLGTRLGLEAAKVRLEIDPIPRKERLVEIIPSGADLGMYDDEPAGEPDETLKVVNTTAELPAGDFPPPEEALAEYERLAAELVGTRPGGDESAIKAAVMAAKRAWIASNMARAGSGETVPVHIQALRIGPVAFVGVPTEPFAQIGAAVRERSPAPHTVFAGYANGSLGYVPMPEAYEEGGYEPRATPFRAGASGDMVEACVSALERLWEDGS